MRHARAFRLTASLGDRLCGAIKKPDSWSSLLGAAGSSRYRGIITAVLVFGAAKVGSFKLSTKKKG